ncbi:hypothetical protein Csal_1207 [Chromohalobacter israelensis DSM 3043]|uniref:Transposase DDE domain-containing protein n=1 Tax=Chromohalobacter israelensis (strain ATCC BAA-138 / DSM 3043 / CIP 106854 / NCIMB 13768 / 1H11) TaxID=290398 RepID=Q1QY96_CHRI1|nr:hypothetical protein Csal_1207 [Chromohalobacter salexigens DSM 3043]
MIAGLMVQSINKTLFPGEAYCTQYTRGGNRMSMRQALFSSVGRIRSCIAMGRPVTFRNIKSTLFNIDQFFYCLSSAMVCMSAREGRRARKTGRKDA